MAGLIMDDLFLMQSPYQPLLVTTAYVLLVTKILPYFMEKKQPFQLTALIRVYNVLQIIINVSLFVTGVETFPHYNMWISHEFQEESETIIKVKKFSHIYLMLKLFDLLETVFFVLRKKTEQVNFLHVFHHVGIIWVSWIACKYFQSDYGYFPCVLNTFAHSFMYIYYLKSSMGKLENQFWKKSLTVMQISHQGLIVITYILFYINTNSGRARLYLSFVLTYVALVICLFLRFYNASYTNKKSKMS